MRSSIFVTAVLTTFGLLPPLILWGDAATAQGTEAESDPAHLTTTDVSASNLTESPEFSSSSAESLLPSVIPPQSSDQEFTPDQPVIEIAEVTDAHGPEFADAHTSAADLRIRPRFSAGHTSSGAWFNGLSRLEGWIPLRQQVGEDITFLEPRLGIDNRGNFLGNLLVGHREYDDDTNRLWAGYLSWDIRETGDSTFNQLGLGMETLGDKWDVHLNGYIPVGDRSDTIEETFLGTGPGLESSSNFEGNLLVLSERQEQIRAFTEEVALGGFDLGTTFEILDWNDGAGDLRALAALYYLGGPNVDDDLGWRLGLEARPIEQIVLGLAVQDDEIFGTNVFASITASFPRVRPRDNVLDEFEEDFEVVERLGEPIRRTPAIAVATVNDVERTVTEVVEPLFNPQNGTDENPGAYRFIHVSLGAGSNGDGTFENPYNNIDDAIADARSNSGTEFGNPETAENQVIYVDASASTNINAFDVPAGVRVLSQAPTQLLNGSNNSFSTFPTVEGRLPFSPDNNFNTGVAGEETGIVVTLPGSGDGDFPVVDSGATDLITLNSNTVLSGFRIENASGNAIIASGAENVEIRDSFIATAGERGIFLDDVSGSVILFDNEISDINGGAGSGQGIFISNTTSDDVEVTARRQTIDSARVGISINVDGDAASSTNPAQIVDIEDTSISNSTDQGLLLTASELGNQQVSFTEDSSITNSGAEGVRIEAQSVSSQEILIQDSTISNSGDAGIRAIGGTLNGSTTAAQEIFIFDNTISNNNGAGIDIIGNEVTAQEFGISGNTITGNTGDGIQAVANNVTFQEFVTDLDNNSDGIGNNIITGNAGQGIDLDANNSATLLADIQDNTLANNTNGADELSVTSNSNSADVCAFVFQNNAGAGSILLDNNSSGAVQGLFEVVDLNGTTLSTNVGTISLLPDISAFTNKTGDVDNSCFTDSDT